METNDEITTPDSTANSARVRELPGREWSFRRAGDPARQGGRRQGIAYAGSVAGNVRIAVIMATHNRRDLTSVFLDSLRAQRLPPGVQVSAFVTDDGSQDGTLELLHEAAVVQRVLESDGTLYWAGSMAWAERVARQSRPDYLLWLNDDVVLDADAVDRVLGLALDEPGAVIVGATRDPVSGVVTYGGRRLRGRHPQRFDQLPISDSPQECDTFNGNCVLVPRAVYELLDGIDGEFAHAYADDDYGMRARRQGVHVLQCPGSIGSCQANVPPPVPRGLRDRWAYYQSPKGLPVSSQVRYLRRHGGVVWPAWFLAGVLRRTFVGSVRTRPQ